MCFMYHLLYFGSSRFITYIHIALVSPHVYFYVPFHYYMNSLYQIMDVYDVYDAAYDCT
jgi:hypothetical protein